MHTSDRRQFAVAFPALADALASAGVGQLLLAARRVRIEPGTPLLRAGQPTGDLFLLLDGKVRMTTDADRTTDLWTVDAGGAVGVSGFLDPGVAELTAAASVPCTVLRLRHDQFLALAATQPRLVQVLLDYLAAELLSARDRMKTLFSTLHMEKLA